MITTSDTTPDVMRVSRSENVISPQPLAFGARFTSPHVIEPNLSLITKQRICLPDMQRSHCEPFSNYQLHSHNRLQSCEVPARHKAAGILQQKLCTL